MRNAQEIAKVISDLANEKGVSVHRSLKESGAGEGLPASLRRGSMPSADRIVMLADYFGVSTEYLLGRTDNPTPPDADAPYVLPEEYNLVVKVRALPTEKRRAIETLINS